jgi:hypothetical protein
MLVILLAGLECACASSVRGGDEPAKPGTLRAVEYRRETIYHSPQTPGYTCWTGAWLQPDDSIVVGFTQATGPIEGRPATSPEVRKKLGVDSIGKDANFEGLVFENVYIHSTDHGKTWNKLSSDKFRTPLNYSTNMAAMATADGAILRGVWGYYLPYAEKLPDTGFIQRSFDMTKTWSDPIVLLDPDKYATFPVRIRQLADGRILVIGGYTRAPANGPMTRLQHWKMLEPLMMISSDDGKTWQGPLEVVPDELRKTWGANEEWDVAELPSGDLLCVFRKEPPGATEVRWQATLKKNGARWKPGDVGPSPSPSPLPASHCHPELLATKEGPVLHFSRSGIHWTNDAGATWHELNAQGTGHYPRSVQTADGRIYAFSHIGGDDVYGSLDESIIMDSFRITDD